MSTTTKSSDDMKAAVDAFLAAYEKGAASLVELQRVALDTAVQQNASAVEFAKKAADAATQQISASGTASAEAFQRGVATLLETQKTLLSIATSPLTSKGTP